MLKSLVEQWLPYYRPLWFRRPTGCASPLPLLLVAPLGVSLLFRDSTSSYDKVGLIGTSSRVKTMMGVLDWSP